MTTSRTQLIHLVTRLTVTLESGELLKPNKVRSLTAAAMKELRMMKGTTDDASMEGVGIGIAQASLFKMKLRGMHSCCLLSDPRGKKYTWLRVLTNVWC